MNQVRAHIESDAHRPFTGSNTLAQQSSHTISNAQRFDAVNCSVPWALEGFFGVTFWSRTSSVPMVMSINDVIQVFFLHFYLNLTRRYSQMQTYFDWTELIRNEQYMYVSHISHGGLPDGNFTVFGKCKRRNGKLLTPFRILQEGMSYVNPRQADFGLWNALYSMNEVDHEVG